MEDALLTDLPLLYRPLTRTAPLHPIRVAKVAQIKAKRKAEALKDKSAATRKRRAIGNRARKNERDTSKAIVRATVASGSLAGDGDARLGEGYHGFDYKLQTKATKQFVVKVDEVTKAWEQQRNIIVISTAAGDRFAVAKLEHFIAFAADIAAMKEELGDNLD